MNQENFNTNLQNDTRGPKTFLVIFITIAILVTGLAIGMGIYLWQSSVAQQKEMRESKTQIEELQKSQKQQIGNSRESAPKEISGFLPIRSTKRCPSKGWFPAKRLTMCQLNEKYNLLVERLGLSKNNYPTGYIVSLENSSTKEKYHLFNQEEPLDAPGGGEIYSIKLLGDDWAELSWATGDMGWFARFFRIIDLAKKKMVPLEITAASDGLTVTKDNKEYKIKLDFDLSNYSYQKGGEILARDLKLNGEPLGLLKHPLSRTFKPHSCMLGCPDLYFPAFKFQSRYTKDFSTIIFSLEGAGKFIFYIADGKVMPYE